MLRAIENLLFCIHNLFRSCTFRQDNALNNGCICNRTPNHDTSIRSSDMQRLNCTQLKCTIAPETAKCEFMFLTVITKKDIALKVVVTSKNKQNNYFLRANAAMHKYNVDEHAFSFMVDRSPIVYLIKEGPVAPHM